MDTWSVVLHVTVVIYTLMGIAVAVLWVHDTPRDKGIIYVVAMFFMYYMVMLFWPIVLVYKWLKNRHLYNE